MPMVLHGLGKMDEWSSSLHPESAVPPSSLDQSVPIRGWVRRRVAFTQSALPNSQEPSASGAICSEAQYLNATTSCIRVHRLSKRYSKNKSAEIPSEDELKTYFQTFGMVEQVSMKPSNPIGFVLFSNTSEAQNALSATIHSVNGYIYNVTASYYIARVFR
ncbi:unnamed protein product [Rodentolepis nana]|uniref:RRM domain-containing protein n=1 Tax=Rodentolepis nana TaxID=102285 RepID=A0A0R3TYI4_RODNA|nr:unnamed protein product [Rodentolepis nana]